MAILGTFKLLPNSTLAPRPGRVDVFICARIDTSGCDNRDLQGLVEAARNAIAAKLALVGNVGAADLRRNSMIP